MDPILYMILVTFGLERRYVMTDSAISPEPSTSMVLI